MRFNNFVTESLQVNEGINDRGIFKGVFMGGTPGAGKTFVSTKIKSGSIEAKVVNIDKFIEIFGQNSYIFQDTARRVTRGQLALHINSMLPLLLDMTSCRINGVVRRYNILESFGYDLAMVFVNTSKEVAWDRIQKRARKVDQEFFEVAWRGIEETKPFLKSKFPLYIEINNDDGMLTDTVIQDVFKKTLFFYDSPVINPMGKEYIRVMQSNGWKYLSPNVVPFNKIREEANRW
jgi:predicted kinase